MRKGRASGVNMVLFKVQLDELDVRPSKPFSPNSWQLHFKSPPALENKRWHVETWTGTRHRNISQHKETSQDTSSSARPAWFVPCECSLSYDSSRL